MSSRPPISSLEKHPVIGGGGGPSLSIDSALNTLTTRLKQSTKFRSGEGRCDEIGNCADVADEATHGLTQIRETYIITNDNTIFHFDAFKLPGNVLYKGHLRLTMNKTITVNINKKSERKWTYVSAPFNHHFLIVQVGEEFALCDAWGMMHSWMMRRMTKKVTYEWVRTLSTLLTQANITKKLPGQLWGLFSKDPNTTRENNLKEYHSECKKLGWKESDCNKFGNSAGRNIDDDSYKLTFSITPYALG